MRLEKVSLQQLSRRCLPRVFGSIDLCRSTLLVFVCVIGVMLAACSRAGMRQGSTAVPEPVIGPVSVVSDYRQIVESIDRHLASTQRILTPNIRMPRLPRIPSLYPVDT